MQSSPRLRTFTLSLDPSTLSKGILWYVHTELVGALAYSSQIGNGDATVTTSRTEFIEFLKQLPDRSGPVTEAITIAGCNTIFWQLRRQNDGLAVLTTERFDLEQQNGRWVAYRSDSEFDSCAASGGCTNIAKRESKPVSIGSADSSNNGKCITKSAASAFVGDFALVFARKYPFKLRIQPADPSNNRCSARLGSPGSPNRHSGLPAPVRIPFVYLWRLSR